MDNFIFPVRDPSPVPLKTSTLEHTGSASIFSSHMSSTMAHSSALLHPDNSRRPVRAATFGIELEFLLVFKEDPLRRVLSKYNIDAKIVKAPTNYERRTIMAADLVDPIASHECHSLYPSWALHVPATDLTGQKHLELGMFCIKSKNERQWIRRCVVEPLLIAKDCLNSKRLDLNVVGWTGYGHDDSKDLESSNIPFPAEDSSDAAVMLTKAEVDYCRWTLTNDHTLLGALRSQLRQHLKSREIPKDEYSMWDSYGMEMISPIFELGKKKEAFEEIGNYLDALDGKETSTLESVWCSIHVHIGWNFEKPGDMPILIFQHLAYILILHEDIITKCHPRSRSGISLPEKVLQEPDVGDRDDDEEFDPDRLWERPPLPTDAELDVDNERAVLAFEAEYTGAYPKGENVLSNARYLRKQCLGRSPCLGEYAIRNAIFKQDGTIFDLVGVLQHDTEHGPYRGYMYNFANLVNLARNKTTWKPIKPTVEFRQHACTLDPAVLEHWLTLLEGIVRKAEERAVERVSEAMMGKAYAEREASKYTASTDDVPWPYQSMRWFCTEFLGLNEYESDYWQGRFETHKDDRPENAHV